MGPALGGAGEAVLLVAEVGHAAVRVGVPVRGGDLGAVVVEDLLLAPGGAAVGGDLDEAEVPVGLDRVVGPEAERGVCGDVDRVRLRRTSAQLWSDPVYHMPSPLCGSPSSMCLSGRLTLTPSSVPRRAGGLAHLDGGLVVARVHLDAGPPSRAPTCPRCPCAWASTGRWDRSAIRSSSGPRSRRRSRRRWPCRTGRAGPGRGRTRARTRRRRSPPAARCSWRASGPCPGWSAPPGTADEWAQMAYVPCAPPPPDLSSPAWTSTTWSMTPSGSRTLPSPSRSPWSSMS